MDRHIYTAERSCLRRRIHNLEQHGAGPNNYDNGTGAMFGQLFESKHQEATGKLLVSGGEAPINYVLLLWKCYGNKTALRLYPPIGNLCGLDPMLHMSSGALV